MNRTEATALKLPIDVPMIQQLLMAVDSDPNMVPARVKLGTLYFFVPR